MDNCKPCDILDENINYGINYLHYGPYFQYYTIPSNDSQINTYCNEDQPQRMGRKRIDCYSNKTNTQKKIWNTVRVPASEYVMNKQSLTVYDGKSWNNQSDRNKYSVTKRNVPSQGNSTKYSLTRMRPGSCSAPGKGVDIKHNSYDRYLAKLKGSCALRTQKNNISPPKNGNKTRLYGIAYSNSCFFK